MHVLLRTLQKCIISNTKLLKQQQITQPFFKRSNFSNITTTPKQQFDRPASYYHSLHPPSTPSGHHPNTPTPNIQHGYFSFDNKLYRKRAPRIFTRRIRGRRIWTRRRIRLFSCASAHWRRIHYLSRNSASQMFASGNVGWEMGVGWSANGRSLFRRFGNGGRIVIGYMNIEKLNRVFVYIVCANSWLFIYAESKLEKWWISVLRERLICKIGLTFWLCFASYFSTLSKFKMLICHLIFTCVQMISNYILHYHIHTKKWN